MYMIKSRNGTDDRLYPADRCTFNTVYSNGNYVVSINPVPTFFPGDSAAGSAIPGADTASTRALLGYICKTGRFVAMTNE